jgi:hypothetical protein
MEYKHAQHCTCSNSSGAYSDFNDLGSWSVCSDCGKAIMNSFEFFHEDNEEGQHILTNSPLSIG